MQFEKDLGSRVGHKCCILSLCVCFNVGAAHCFNTFDDYLLVEQRERAWAENRRQDGYLLCQCGAALAHFKAVYTILFGASFSFYGLQFKNEL